MVLGDTGFAKNFQPQKNRWNSIGAKVFEHKKGEAFGSFPFFTKIIVI
jgi:hypothetical protein